MDMQEGKTFNLQPFATVVHPSIFILLVWRMDKDAYSLGPLEFLLECFAALGYLIATNKMEPLLIDSI